MIDEKFISECEKGLSESFSELEKNALYNQEKVLNAFKNRAIASRHFSGSTGYGYGDDGREALNGVMADVFKAESAICSPYITCGTHALSLCLFGVLRPGDTVLSVTGTPYDTLSEIIDGGAGSLSEYNIKFRYVTLKDGKIDLAAVRREIETLMPKMVYIQRSRGYEWRNSLSANDIRSAIKSIRGFGFDGCVMVDNCYGEFVEKEEPIEAGANLTAGSMIKNPGGGIAQTGGYVAGDKKYVDLVAARMTTPSLGAEVGSYVAGYRTLFQGLFIAPHTVLQALKGSLLFGAVLSRLGYETLPISGEMPHDITRSIKFGSAERLISFIQTIQKNSPIDSFVEALPWEMPGYNDPVIMAAGCFIQGSSIELSADGPVKPPYIAYMQGGITYEHCKIALKNLNL